MYDMEDLEYYTQEAIDDLNNKGIAPCKAGIVIRVGDDLYMLKCMRWDAKSHKFLKLVGNVRNIIQTIIIMGNGYKDEWEAIWEGPLFRADAIKLMEMGLTVAHERYPHVTFKMVDGKIMDHWDDKDEPDQWYDFDPKNYQYPDTLTNDECVGWTIAN